MHGFEIVIVMSMLAVVAVLLGGLTNMVAFGEAGASRSNQLMVARCLFQGLTLVLLAVAAVLTAH